MGYGIDVGSSTVKVVSVQRTLRGFKVVSAVRRRSGAAPAKLIHEALAGNGSPRAGVVGLSGRDINLQVLVQSGVKPLQYRVMMGYEVNQRKGQAGDSYVDFCTLREPDPYFPQYLALIGIGRSAYVDERIQQAAQASIDVRDAVPNSFALYTAYRNAYDAEGGTVLLLDIGADTLDLAFVRGGRLVFARNVSSGARLFDQQVAGMLNLSPEDAEAMKVSRGNLGPSASPADEEKEEELRAPIRSAAGQLAGVITSSIHHAKVQLNDREFSVDKIYLSGGGSRVRGLAGYLTGALKIAVDVLDPFRRLDTSTIEKLGGADFKVLPTDMAVAIGLAQLVSPRADQVTLSLLPDRLKKRRDFLRSTFWLVLAGSVLAAALLAVTGIVWARKSSRQSALDAFRSQFGTVTQKIERMNALELEQRELSAKLDYLATTQANGRGLTDVVVRLRRNLPPKGITLREVRLVDPRREGSPGDRQRAALLASKRGVVLGEVESESTQEIRIRGQGVFKDEEVKGGLAKGVEHYPALARAVLIGGEVDENLPGGALEALNALKDALTDATQGTRAEIQSQSASGRQGWTKFEILVGLE